jgi:hypothetical protein
VDQWDQLVAWRAEQRDQEEEQRVEQGKAAICADEARAMREKVRAAIANLHAAQRGGADGRVYRARALLAGARTAFLWKRAVAGWYSHRADDHAAAALLLKVKIAGG